MLSEEIAHNLNGKWMHDTHAHAPAMLHALKEKTSKV